MLRCALPVLVVLVTASPTLAQHQAAVTIYVGPQIRNGFVDVDSGVVDSIKDTQAELRKRRGFQVVSRETDARLRLYIVGRGIGAYRGQAGVPLATGAALSVPLNARVVDAVLKVGDYEKSLTADDGETGAWRECAETLADDVVAWVNANRDRLPQ